MVDIIVEGKNKQLHNTIEINQTDANNINTNNTDVKKPTGNFIAFFYVNNYPMFVLGPHCN